MISIYTSELYRVLFCDFIARLINGCICCDFVGIHMIYCVFLSYFMRTLAPSLCLLIPWFYLDTCYLYCVVNWRDYPRNGWLESRPTLGSHLSPLVTLVSAAWRLPGSVWPWTPRNHCPCASFLPLCIYLRFFFPIFPTLPWRLLFFPSIFHLLLCDC